jgi:hypothetical protein
MMKLLKAERCLIGMGARQWQVAKRGVKLGAETEKAEVVEGIINCSCPIVQLHSHRSHPLLPSLVYSITHPAQP